MLLSPLSGEDRSCESQKEYNKSRDGRPTLEEFLACVFLEESFMGNGTGKVVNHQLKNWLDCLFGVTSVVSQGGVLLSLSYSLELGVVVETHPFASLKDLACEIH